MHLTHFDQGSTKGILYILVFSFNSSIGLGVVGRREEDFDVERFEDVLEDVGDEAVAVVADGHRWYPEDWPSIGLRRSGAASCSSAR